VPSKDEHLRQAQHNEGYLATFDLAATPYLDWAVTAVFYTALHYLRALMSSLGYAGITSYGDMDKAFDRFAVLKQNPAIYADYRSLKDDSWSARYNMWRPSPADVVDLRDNEFERIRSFVRPRL
jgi:hypothetical protein